MLPTLYTVAGPECEIRWYDPRKPSDPGGGHASPFVQEPVNARVLAVFGLAGCTLTGCGGGGGGEPRRVEPRLTGDSAYSRCTIDAAASDLIPDARCEGQPRPEKNGSAPPGGGSVLRGGAGQGSVGSASRMDLSRLLAAGDVGVAIRRLEAAVAVAPHDAGSWSDLAASYLVRAQRLDDPRDLLRAYGAAVRATEENPSQPEARFNRALSLERLYLFPAAASAWRDYLDLETTPDWAAEARARKAALDRPAQGEWGDQEREALEQAALAGDAKGVETFVDRYRQEAREYAEQALFGSWADAEAGGATDEAADRLRVLRAVGEALAKLAGDRLVLDAVLAIDAAAGDPARQAVLLPATREFRDGYKVFTKREPDAAAQKLTAALSGLVQAGSPLAFRAESLLLGCDYFNHHYSDAIAGAEQLVRRLAGKPYPAVSAQVFRIKALAEITKGAMKDGIEDYGRMRSAYQSLGEKENLAAADGLLGESLMLLGRTQEAWRSLYQALKVTPQLRSPGDLARTFMIAGDAALREGAGEAALAFDREWVRYASRTSPREAVEALTWLARMQDHVGDREDALATLREAKRRTALLEPEQRRRKQADLAMVEGTMHVESDPLRAAELLTTALGVQEKDENVIFSLQTRLARGRAYRKAGDDRNAERDFEAALSLYDRMGEQLDQEDLRLTLLEEEDEAFDEMISLQASHDSDRAFAYADRVRTRVLPGSASTLWTGDRAQLDRLLASEPQPLPLAEILRQVPTGVSLVQFSVLEDRVLIWLLRRQPGGARFFQQIVRRRDLEAQVARLQQFDRPDWDETAAGLFDRLVWPWLDAVPGEERIVFIPDKVLHRVPFAALKDRSTGRFLFESHPLAIAPSATLYVNALARQGGDRRPFRSPGLVVGEPEVDHSRFESLVALPAAAAEAGRLARQTGSRLLLGKAAYKSAFLERARDAEWIQFSGHALVDPQNTLLSKLVLAPGPDGDPGVLTAREIYPLDLSGTRFVVLAACETGNQYVPGSEGVTSLARAFLAAGVPTVVASLWSVADQTTANLFDAFHRHLWDGADPVDALRQAQLEMLRSGHRADRSPGAWAAFEAIGASVK